MHAYTPYPQISSQLDTFRVHLEEFARRHKNDIRKDPNFRGHLQQMCARIGVDPLACETLGLVLQPGSCGGCSEMGVGRVAAFYTQITIQRKNSFACNYTKMTGVLCCSSLLPHTCTASKGFWAQALGVGDFYYEVSRLTHSPNTKFSLQKLEDEARLTSIPGFLFHIWPHSFAQKPRNKIQSRNSSLVPRLLWNEATETLGLRLKSLPGTPQ